MNGKSDVKRSACMLGHIIYDVDARVKKYVQFLLHRGFRVDVLCVSDAANKTDDKPVESVSLVVVKELPRAQTSRFNYLLGTLVYLFKAAWKLSALQFKRRYTVVHVHNMPDFFVFAAIVPKLGGAVVILDIHDRVPELYARKFGTSTRSVPVRLLRFVERVSCRFADHVIIANDVWRQRLIDEGVIPAENCTALPNFPDTNLFRARDPVSARQLGSPCKIIYHGSFTEFHGVDVAIKAMARLKEKLPSVQFLIYGGGPYEAELRRLIAELGVEEIVKMCGSVSYSKVGEVLRGCDIAVVPKKAGVFSDDALSTKLFEYAAVGLPAVVSRTSAEMRYFSEGEVRYFNPGDAEDMARCIRELYENPDLRHSLVVNAGHRLRHYGIEQIESGYTELVERLASR